VYCIERAGAADFVVACACPALLAANTWENEEGLPGPWIAADVASVVCASVIPGVTPTAPTADDVATFSMNGPLVIGKLASVPPQSALLQPALEISRTG
jgi:hypothetical protein